jgi:RHS repeat-associated protein
MTFSYDGNGNLISGTDGRTNSYTVFNKPYAMSRAGSTVTIDYGPNRERYRRLDNVSGQVTVTHYVGSIEKITRPGPVIEIKRYLDGEAIETITGSTRTTEYLFTDHLGSVDVITNATGSVVQSMAFDAFGRRRDAVDYDAFTDPMIFGFDTTKTTRGFTFHEQLDPVGLIHMNGRVYDPTLGRFLSPDPFVQDPSNTQSLNRYSYVFNNPLSYSDPSGYFSVKEAFSLAVGIVVSVYCPACSATWWQVMATGAAIGGMNGALMTGSLQGAVMGAFSGGISAGAFHGIGLGFADRFKGNFLGSQFNAAGLLLKSAAHGLVGGVMGSLMGGRFGNGFASAFVTQLGSGGIDSIDAASDFSIQRIVVAAIVGGTASAASGGNFANGAMVGAFSRAFNDELSGRRARPSTQSAGERVVAAAEEALANGEGYGTDDRSGNFPPGSYKCNKLAFDIAERAGAPLPASVDSNGNSWPPLAGTLGNPNIRSVGRWEIVSDPQPGDLVAQQRGYSDASGHVGIVVDRSLNVISARDWGISKDPMSSVFPHNYRGDDFQKGPVVYRRYSGD